MYLTTNNISKYMAWYLSFKYQIFILNYCGYNLKIFVSNDNAQIVSLLIIDSQKHHHICR